MSKRPRAITRIRRLKGRECARDRMAREEEALVLLTHGFSNKKIAGRLGLGVETVRSHLKHLCEKMRVHSRTDAVARYLTAKAPWSGCEALDTQSEVKNHVTRCPRPQSPQLQIV